MSLPTFTLGYPKDGQSLGASKSVIRNNLDGTFNAFGLEHNTQNASADVGLHRKSTYPVRSNRPSTAVGQINIYSRAITGGTALFTSRDNNSATVTQISNPNVIAPLAATNGYSYLPGGLIIQWGTKVQNFAHVDGSGTVTGNGTVTFPIPFPSNCYNINIQPKVINNDPSSPINIYPLSNTLSSFTIRFINQTSAPSNPYQDFYWTAIGR